MTDKKLTPKQKEIIDYLRNNKGSYIKLIDCPMRDWKVSLLSSLATGNQKITIIYYPTLTKLRRLGIIEKITSNTTHGYCIITTYRLKGDDK